MTTHSQPTVVVNGKAEDRLRSGHPWIYRADIVSVHAEGGDTVAIRGPRGRTIGRGLYSERSQIALRLLTHGESPAGLDLWRDRIRGAVAFRRSLSVDATACRLVHGEADLLPSFVVDEYDRYLVVQALSQGTERLLPDLLTILSDELHPAGVLARHDQRVRALEGLDQSIAVLAGEIPDEVIVREGEIEFGVDLRQGQKTGLFLDQRENRAAARAYARGRLLDCFSYHGSFALQLAPRCDAVLAIDVSDDAITRLAQNALRNGLTNVEARVANVFDELRRLERAGDQFDIVVLDPPAFAKSRDAVEKAYAGYKEINLRAMKVLRPGGVLVTCTCSYHISEAAFGEIVFDASIDARAQVTVLEKRMQARDHPVLLGVPETYYLKCFILRRVS
jgi:23S rRNA (cytosine1962-C5)-methyltransferase